MKTYLTLESFGEGKLLEKRTQQSRSWLKHFWDLFYGPIGNLSLNSVPDINGANRTLDYSAVALNLAVNAPGGNMGFFTNREYYGSGAWIGFGGLGVNDGSNGGIVLGTDSTPVTPIQNALVAKVPHGEAAGNLLYAGMEIYGLAIANPNGEFKLRRFFSNVSGGDITIQEVGIYSYGSQGYSGYEVYTYCIARDVVSPGVLISNGQLLAVTYTVQIAV
jgi:hypothetical protein